MSRDDMPDEWTVPVNGVSTRIKKIPASECELCAKCKRQLGANTHRGRKRVKQRMEGVDEKGRPMSGVGRVSKSFYYCSPECLERHGAVEEEGFGF